MSAAPGDLPASRAFAPNSAVERVLTAAADLCTLVGVKATTISDVARHADVSEDAVCAQWETITDIVSAVVIRDFHAQIDATESRIGAHESLEDKIVEGFVTAYCFLDGHPIVGGAVRSDAEIISPAAQVSVATAVTAVIRWLIDTISSAVRLCAGLILDVESLEEVTARLVQSMLLAPNTLPPASARSDTARYARRSFVPLVYAMCRPDSIDPSN